MHFYLESDLEMFAPYGSNQLVTDSYSENQMNRLSPLKVINSECFK
jgi:hypothetical protein